MPGRGRRRRGQSPSDRQPPRSWAIRGLVAGILLIAAYKGTLASLAHPVAKADLARAHLLAPGNEVITAKFAEEELGRRPTTEPSALPARLARQALLADATAVEAITVLGLQAQLRGETEKANRLFSYSTTLSRRELRPRLWAIEEAVSRGDIAGALHHYDTALRTSKEATTMLYPTLNSALAEPRIRTELLKVLATHPAWRDGFLSYAAASGVEAEGALALMVEGQTIGLRLNEQQSVDLVNALLSANKQEAAWGYYRSLRQGARRDRSRDPKFLLATESRAKFDWQIGGDTALGAALLNEKGSGLLDFAVPPSRGGALITQTQLLPKGDYRLQGRSRGLNQPNHSRPFWLLTCIDGRELGRIIVSNSDQSGGRFAGSFRVPQGCEQQTLTLMARPSDDIMGVTGQIESVQLYPAR